MSPEEVTSKHTHLELYAGSDVRHRRLDHPLPGAQPVAQEHLRVRDGEAVLGFSTPTFRYRPSSGSTCWSTRSPRWSRPSRTELLNIDERPFGTNAVVAVLSFEGYNIEDAIIMNKSSIERGFARSFFYRLYEAESKQYLGGMRDTFEVPSAESNIRGYRGEKFYRLLEGDGVVMHESQVTGRRRRHRAGPSPPRFMEEYKEFEIKGPYRRDTSVAVRPTETGVVDCGLHDRERRGREDVQGQGQGHADT